MTKEESIKKADKIISDLQLVIQDIESEKNYFIDYNEDIGNNDENLIGITPIGTNLYSILYYKKYELFTKTIIKK